MRSSALEAIGDRPIDTKRFGAQQVDGASLAAFRALFGTLMCFATVRTWAMGWIEQLYIAPRFHFTYSGLDFVRPLPGVGMYVVFFVMALAAAMVALGLFYRVAIATFFVTFTYVELIDQITYLNHYYLISVLALMMCFLPLERRASIDARLRPSIASATQPRAALYAIRFQIGLVYFFAGLAKLNHDWLIDAEPLSTWLRARSDLPVLGPFLAVPWVGHAMSLGGALFDLSIPFALLHPRTRPIAYVAVVVFHVLTGLLFPIGMFPWMMIALTLIFFSPDWPEQLARRLVRARSANPAPISRSHTLGRVTLALFAVHFVVQLVIPLRHFAYPGDVSFTEEGMRFAWRVMIVEKAGRLELRAREGDREWLIDPTDELTFQQRRVMATSPDMILLYAHHVRDRYRAEGRDVEIRASCFVAMNGHRSRPLIDPSVDLAQEPDDLRPRRWVLR